MEQTQWCTAVLPLPLLLLLQLMPLMLLVMTGLLLCCGQLVKHQRHQGRTAVAAAVAAARRPALQQQMI
jgi:hypothetical protein